ncbi:MAG: urease [Candidatus Entotheonella gemina]|uniref:Urease n=2 Tax=Candidatus Entotheonella TaxID=93171 RepID=W4M6C3_9BACT|nr:MAG: urease [Candidatus Entotheonella gemina]
MEARICTYECTFCAACIETVLHNVCPNCDGGFVPRPIRPSIDRRQGVSLMHQPASTQRVHLKYSTEEIKAFVAGVKDIAPEHR